MSDMACGRCGADPAAGSASINDVQYCHEGKSPTCYELASQEEARRVADWVREKLGLLQHNHVTRDVKEPGECPACDAYHERQAEIIGPSYMRSPMVRRWVDEFSVWMRERETWFPQKDAPFWDRLGVYGDLPAHLPMGVNEQGQGPVEPNPAHHYECWCGDIDCPLAIALQHAWLAGRRSGE